MVKKGREILSRKIWAIYKRNTANYLSHKDVYILLLVSTIQTSVRNRSVQCSDIAQSKNCPELQGPKPAKIKIKIMPVFLWIHREVMPGTSFTCRKYLAAEKNMVWAPRKNCLKDPAENLENPVFTYM